MNNKRPPPLPISSKGYSAPTIQAGPILLNILCLFLGIAIGVGVSMADKWREAKLREATAEKGYFLTAKGIAPIFREPNSEDYEKAIKECNQWKAKYLFLLTHGREGTQEYKKAMKEEK